ARVRATRRSMGLCGMVVAIHCRTGGLLGILDRRGLGVRENNLRGVLIIIFDWLGSETRGSDVTKIADPDLPPGTTGLILHRAAFYDFTVWLMTLGRERAFRENILRLIQLSRGEAVLDVGCGTGSLAIAAKQRVGPTGIVNAIDASPEMLARAEKKAMKSCAEVAFTKAAAQALPFPDSQFDAVLSTVMLHH